MRPSELPSPGARPSRARGLRESQVGDCALAHASAVVRVEGSSQPGARDHTLRRAASYRHQAIDAFPAKVSTLLRIRALPVPLDRLYSRLLSATGCAHRRRRCRGICVHSSLLQQVVSVCDLTLPGRSVQLHLCHTRRIGSFTACNALSHVRRPGHPTIQLFETRIAPIPTYSASPFHT